MLTFQVLRDSVYLTPRQQPFFFFFFLAKACYYSLHKFEVKFNASLEKNYVFLTRVNRKRSEIGEGNQKCFLLPSRALGVHLGKNVVFIHSKDSC